MPMLSFNAHTLKISIMPDEKEIKVELDADNTLKVIKIAHELDLSYKQVVNFFLRSVQAADLYLDVYGEVRRQEDPGMRKIRVRRQIKMFSRP